MNSTGAEAMGTCGTAVSRVLIVDDHPIVRSGLGQLVQQEADLQVCGEASDASEALDEIERKKPDLVLVDISLGGSSGIELTKTIRERYERLPVLVLSMHDESLYAERALRAGAKGYVMKQEAAETVLKAIRKVLGGGLYVSDTIAARMLQEFVEGGSDQARVGVETLSDRELEVFEMIGRGMPTREIAERLHLSVKTIETHRAHIKQKLNLRNATELLHHAVHWMENEQRSIDAD
jgi:DNA-binding NarL/FixJ family response regulator